MTLPLREAYRALDIGRLNRARLLEDGAYASWRWGDGGNINIIGGQEHIELVYGAHPPGADAWEQMREMVLIERTSCNYGGTRPWFLCPLCYGRAFKLYGGRRFLCRSCRGFAYTSQRESDMYRLLTRAQDIRIRLGGTGNTSAPFPPKPKGMHWRTYWRLRDESEEASLRSLRCAAQRFGWAA